MRLSRAWGGMQLYRIGAVVTAFFIVSFGAISAGSAADLIETKAKRIHLVDADTGFVLLSREADTPFPPGSLAKLMTAEVMFHALGKGQVTPETEYFVSEHA